MGLGRGIMTTLPNLVDGPWVKGCRSTKNKTE